MKLFFQGAGKLLLFTVILVFVLASVFMLYANMPAPAQREDVSFGISFSARYATSLGLSWQETYLALLDDMGVRKIRIPLYWDEIEKTPREYDFSAIDWQLSEARKRNATVIVAMGQKVPRWPECFEPAWMDAVIASEMKPLETESRETVMYAFVATDTKSQIASSRAKKLLAFEEVAVNRYKDHPEVQMWQVENEPFLDFGNCPHFDISILDQEIALVKSLQTGKPILTTANGEMSLWIRPADRGDYFGTTLYRDLWSARFGRYITYPIGPNFFIAKEMLVRLFTQQTNFLVIELQAEPWASGFVADIPLSEQFLTMDEHKLVANIEYAKQVGFPEIYLWGAEWWYWMKVEKNYPAVWDTAKQYF
jgi:hypothetical protein